MEENEKLRSMTDLLFSGAKMLGVHCEECKGPLFEYKDQIICPTCDKVLTGKEEEAAAAKAAEAKTEIVPGSPIGDLTLAIQEKLQDIAEQIRTEKDPAKTKTLMELAEKGIDILKQLKTQ